MNLATLKSFPLGTSLEGMEVERLRRTAETWDRVPEERPGKTIGEGAAPLRFQNVGKAKAVGHLPRTVADVEWSQSESTE